MKKIILFISLFVVSAFSYAQSISMTIANVSALQNTQVAVPVTVTNFNNIGAISLKISYDPAVLTFDSLGALPTGNFTVNAAGGVVSIGWFALPNPLNLGDGQLFKMYFQYSNGTSALNFNTALCEIADINGTPLPVYYANGSVTLDVVSVVLSNVHATPQTKVAVPISVTKFINIGAISLKVNFDPTKATLDSVQGIARPSNEFFWGVNNGVITIGWFSLTPLNLQSGQLVRLHFRYLNGTTTLTFNTAECEITASNGVPLTGVVYTNGMITSNINVTIKHAQGVVGNKVGVPIDVTNFMDIGAVSLKINYNPTVVTFDSLSNLPRPASEFTFSASGGVLTIGWFSLNPLNIVSGKFLDVYFTYNGGTTPLTFNTGLCEISNSSAQPLTVNYNSGSVSAGVPVTLELGNVTSPANSSVSVPLNVTNFNNIGAISLKINFDPSILTFSSVTNLPSGVSFDIIMASGNTITLGRYGINPINVGNGKLADLNFAYTTGNTPVTFNVGLCEITDANGVVLNVNYSNGSVTLLPPPPVPTLVSPANGSINQPRTITLTWDPSATATSYRVLVATDNGFVNIVKDTTVTGTSLLLSNLANLTQYYWKVSATGPGGTSSYSSVWWFKTYNCKNVNVVNGWNNIAVPVVAANMGVSALFPTATSQAFQYIPGTGYQTATTLVNGVAYWLKFGSAQSIEICGSNVPAYTVPVQAGWNMIGVFDNDVNAAQITSTPPGIVSSPYYEYNNGYQIVGTLSVGKGYFVKVSANGVLNIPTVLAKVEPVYVSAYEDKIGKIYFEDSKGNTTILYVDNKNTNLDYYELPPIPPAGIFDARYTSDRNVEYFTNNTNTIKISSASYPIKIRVEGVSLKFKDEITGKLLDRTIQSGEELVIDDARLNLLSVQAIGLTPLTYNLYNNYPNPFNPSTLIKFSIPEKAKVRLSVYNTLGQLVTELVNGELEAGYHQAQFDAKDLTSGMYLYKLETNNYSSVKKMLLLK